MHNTPSVNDVRGEFYVVFKYEDSVATPQFIDFNNAVNTLIRIGYTVTPRAANDFSALIEKENFVKINGVLTKNPYDSAILNKKGEYSHYWTVRLNARQATYNTLTLEDKIAENSAPSQIVPVTLERLPGAIFNIQKPNGDIVVLDSTDENGKTYNKVPFTAAEINAGNFVITEQTAPKGYKKDDTPISIKLTANGISRTVKNQRLADVSGDKIWDVQNNLYNSRPDSVTLNLKQNGAVVKTLQVDVTTVSPTNPNRWSFDFGEYPYYDANGTKYNYEIEEVAPQGYKNTIDAEGNITNTLEVTKVSALKQWHGPKQDKAEVKVYNKNDLNTELGKKEITEATGWGITFENLPKYNRGGTRAEYTVKETPIPNYDTKITCICGGEYDDYLIENTNTEKTQVKVLKEWIGPKQDKVEVKIYNEKNQSNVVETAIITAAQDWKHVFKGLMKYNSDGSEAKYIVVETPIENYKTEILNTQNGYIITNIEIEKSALPQEEVLLLKPNVKTRVDTADNSYVFGIVMLLSLSLIHI